MWLSLNPYLNIMSLQPPLMICYVIARYVVLMIVIYSAGCWRSQISITRKAYELARALEAADKSAEDLQAKPSSIRLAQGGDNTTNKSRSSKPVVCHRCGGPHKAPACTFQKSKCHKCGKVGHIAMVCRSKGMPQRSTAATPPQPQHTFHVDEHSSDSEPECPEYPMHSLNIVIQFLSQLNSTSQNYKWKLTLGHQDPLLVRAINSIQP